MLPALSNRSPQDTYQAYARRPKRRGASSQYRGVSFRRQTQRWIAQVYWRGRRTFLGSFQSEQEAARAYNLHARRIIGEIAVLNELPGEPEQASPKQTADFSAPDFRIS